MDLDNVHYYLVQKSVLGHYSTQGGFDDPVLEEFEEWAFEDTAPDEIFLSGLPLYLLNGAKHLYFSLEDEGQDFDE